MELLLISILLNSSITPNIQKIINQIAMILLTQYILFSLKYCYKMSFWEKISRISYSYFKENI